MKKILPILLFVLLFILNDESKAQTQSLSASPKVSIISCFPNPAVSSITFSFEKKYEKGYSIHIYNFLGKKMYEAVNMGEQTTVNLANFNKGLYIYQLFDQRGKLLESGKFQVSKF